MEKISTNNVRVGEKVVLVTVYKIEEVEKIKDISRVYVLAGNEKGEVALIFNSKREIWGFPGGHPNENETIKESAQRECIEEINYSIKNCELKYVLSNKLDDNKEELQAICFAKINEVSKEFVDEDESVSEVKFVTTDKILEEVGNSELWKDIIQGYSEWLEKVDNNDL